MDKRGILLFITFVFLISFSSAETFSLGYKETKDGYFVYLSENDVLKFVLRNNNFSVDVENLSESKITLFFIPSIYKSNVWNKGKGTRIILDLGEKRSSDIDFDGRQDVMLKYVSYENGRGKIMIQSNESVNLIYLAVAGSLLILFLIFILLWRIISKIDKKKKDFQRMDEALGRSGYEADIN